jgi:hypothetical protein
MSIEELRKALTSVEISYSEATERGLYEISDLIFFHREQLWKQLVSLIQTENPFTTEADIRYFENSI